MSEWLRQDQVLGYIINAYAGVEPISAEMSKMRRVFLWEEGHEVKMGNAEAFMIHLGKRFDRETKAMDASELHRLLRDLGDSMTPHSKQAPRRANSPRAGQFRQPDPEEWVVRRQK